jgi:type VI secretion system protein ImpF
VFQRKNVNEHQDKIMPSHPLKQGADNALLPTLFDRLIDHSPSTHTEAPSGYAIDRQAMLAIVLRDLSYLLNTTNLAPIIDSKIYPEVHRSTVNYGLPPLAGSYLSDRRWHEMEKMIRQAILNFEPRLLPDALKVTPLKGHDHRQHYNTLLFEISGFIHMNPYPMAFLCRSAIDLENNRLHVTTDHLSIKDNV